MLSKSVRRLEHQIFGLSGSLDSKFPNLVSMSTSAITPHSEESSTSATTGTTDSAEQTSKDREFATWCHLVSALSNDTSLFHRPDPRLGSKRLAKCLYKVLCYLLPTASACLLERSQRLFSVLNPLACYLEHVLDWRWPSHKEAGR